MPTAGTQEKSYRPGGEAPSAVARLWAHPIFVLSFGLICAALALTLLIATKPTYSEGSCEEPGNKVTPFEYPFLNEYGPHSEKTLSFKMRVGKIHPSRFIIHVSDVVGKIDINSEGALELRSFIPPYDQVRIDLGDFLRPGENDVKVYMTNYDPKSYFYWLPSLFDPWLLTILTLGLLALASVLRLAQLLRPIYLQTGEAIVLFCAIGLRMIYACATPYSIRAYDWEGHLYYVQYVAKHLSKPPVESGWETFQPPLFYWIFGWLGHGVYALGGSFDLALILWQVASFIVSALTVVAALWAGRLLFPDPKLKWRLWFVALLSAVPSLVFFSSRISNDILFGLVSFTTVGALTLFWTSPSWRNWLIVAALVALGLLTKSTSLVFIPVVAMALFFATRFPWKKKAQLFTVFVAVIALLAGWFALQRGLESRDSTSFVVRNLEKLDPRQKMEPTIAKLLTFNVAELLKQPFVWVGNNPRYDRFPEFFFKSALFSEGRPGRAYRPIAITILVCALILLAFAFYGAWRSLYTTTSLAWPLFVVALGFVSAQMFGAFTNPYACLQNFRYSVVVLIPAFYFVVRGIECTHPKFQRLGIVVCGIFTGLNVGFVLFQRSVLM